MKLTTNQLYDLRNSINDEPRSQIKAEVYFNSTLGQPGRTIATARDRHGVKRDLVIFQMRDPNEVDAEAQLLGLSTMDKLDIPFTEA